MTRYNQAAIVYNSELSQEIQRLNNTLPGSKVVYIDMYTPIIDMIQRPSAYGNVLDIHLYLGVIFIISV